MTRPKRSKVFLLIGFAFLVLAIVLKELSLPFLGFALVFLALGMRRKRKVD